MDNIFIRFGNWLAKKPLEDRMFTLEALSGTQGTQIDALIKANKELNDHIVKLEMHVGFRRIGKSKEDVRTLLDAWEGLQ